MKQTRKLLSILLALAMVCALATTAFAEDTYSITINNSAEGHTYEAYQIFAGELSVDEESAKKVLSNIVWGSGISEDGKTALGDAAAKAETLKTEADAKAFAKAVASYLTTAAGSASTVTDGKYVISGLEAGYYLVKDQEGTLTGDDDAYTSYILQVVKDVEVKPKSAKPTVDKQVQDETGDKEVNADADGWGETADHAINETFQFKLIATLPSDGNLNDYDSYKLVFTDTMSAGVTFESIVSVTATNSNNTDIVYSCTAKNGDAGTTWTLTIEDLTDYVTQLPGTVVTVIYKAHLNENAVIENGTPRNKNTVGLQYSNNPNWSGEGEELGKTPEDTVWVFTYKVDNTKYADKAQTGNELANAGFRLYTDEACTTEVQLIKDGNNYRPVKADEIAVEMKSGDDGKFNIIGLDAGTYYLKETTTPEGYNTCDVIKIVISATHSENAEGTDGSTTISMTVDGKSATKNDVVNNSGATLPETGGIGTTIFYTLGGILVLVAVVLLVTKKRMNGAEV